MLMDFSLAPFGNNTEGSRRIVGKEQLQAIGFLEIVDGEKATVESQSSACGLEKLAKLWRTRQDLKAGGSYKKGRI